MREEGKEMDADMSVESLERMERALKAEPRGRELYVRMLEYCKERRGLDEVERYVQCCPQFGLAAQSPYRLALNLVELGGLEMVELDEDGLEVTPDRKEGLSADEADDLVASYAFETTADGAQAAEDLSPSARFASLLEEHPDRAQVFADVLDFCEEPRSYADIAGYIAQNAAAQGLRARNGQHFQASYFIDMLERAGMLEWDGAWNAGGAWADVLGATAPTLGAA